MMSALSTAMAYVVDNLTITYGIDVDSFNETPQCFQNLSSWNHCIEVGYLKSKLHAIHLTSVLPVAEMEFKVYDTIVNGSVPTNPSTMFGALLAGKRTSSLQF